jgi:hypothetical protein
LPQLAQLQDDAWKLQVFAELEMLKRQLAAIQTLDDGTRRTHVHSAFCTLVSVCTAGGILA